MFASSQTQKQLQIHLHFFVYLLLQLRNYEIKDYLGVIILEFRIFH